MGVGGGGGAGVQNSCIPNLPGNIPKTRALSYKAVVYKEGVIIVSWAFSIRWHLYSRTSVGIHIYEKLTKCECAAFSTSLANGLKACVN